MIRARALIAQTSAATTPPRTSIAIHQSESLHTFETRRHIEILQYCLTRDSLGQSHELSELEMASEEPAPDQMVVEQPTPVPNDESIIENGNHESVPNENENENKIENQDEPQTEIQDENQDSTPAAPVLETPTRKKGTEIAPELRGTIYNRYLKGESFGAIAKAENLPKSTIQHVVRKVKETGSTATKPRCGRPLKTGDLSRTTLRRRKLKGLLVDAAGGNSSPSNQVASDATSALAYPITSTLSGNSDSAVAGAPNPFIQQPPPPPQPHPPTTVVCTDIYGINHATPTTELQWRPAAYAIVLKNASILLLRQNGGAYDLPGGGIHLGEDPRNAVLRELKEETGINATDPTILGTESSLFRATHADGGSYHSLLMYYGCSYVGGKISTRGLDAGEKLYVEGAEWVKLSNLDGINVSSTVDFRPYVRKLTGKA